MPEGKLINVIRREIKSIKMIRQLENLIINLLNIRNRLAVLLIVSAVMLFANAAVAAECKDTYYYASYGYSPHYLTRRIRAFDLSVSNAYIYDLPKLPSSWVYVLDINEVDVTNITAAAKSDKHAIRYKDFEKFIILRQPKYMSGKNIMIGFSLIYMKKEGGIDTEVDVLDPIHYSAITLEKIDKCLPKKPLRH
ncbi:hypothetical protein [Candidatus Magnetominusculus xianensis]|uniref:Secreted protein n=1 Tax=Candidatus Magnetominusculus xianensis TaxID=1748249 RepID=A0ABR5SIG4_9BACT|nr:hypothetical protein [Candidatus Magnetominusculus xianensis]KWT92680.1 hypothetical protein ASN18_0511 [Candidatus Magnetominusculus xianensis]MBF0403769.1 hypothetical protein [Nitrospirota bacterium]